MYKKLSICLAALFFAYALPSFGQSMIPGQVVDVLDGKTVVVAISTGKVNVELQYIDVPEPDQPLYDSVKDHLRRMVMSKAVTIKARNFVEDKTTGLVMLKDVDVSQQMLRDGAAWHVPLAMSGQEAESSALYDSVEADAKKEKRGVWSVPDLQPAWEFRAAKTREQYTPKENPTYARAAGRGSVKGSYWSDQNPNLTNIGALFNGYNAASHTGFVSTSFLGVKDLDPERPFDGKMAVDVTYWYREDVKKGRTGIFVFTLVSESDKLHFQTQNSLIFSDDNETTINLGRPKRTVIGTGDNRKEILSYKVGKATVEKLASLESANLRIGQHVFWIMNVRYFLFNMLDVARQ